MDFGQALKLPDRTRTVGAEYYCAEPCCQMPQDVQHLQHLQHGRGGGYVSCSKAPLLARGVCTDLRGVSRVSAKSGVVWGENGRKKEAKRLSSVAGKGSRDTAL
jgi:hypothetical protein